MRKFRNRLLAALGLTFLTGFAAISWSVLQERLLLKRARPVTSARGWSVDRGPDAATAYGWLSDHEVLYCSGGSLGGVTLFRRDVRSGTETELRWLTALFRKTHGDVDGLSISPDSRYVLWCDEARSTTLASLNHPHFQQYRWPGDGWGDYYWIGTVGSRWIEVSGIFERTSPIAGAVLHDPEAPAQDRKLNIPAWSIAVRPGGVVTQDTDGLHLLASDWKSESPRSVSQFAQLSRYSLALPRTPPQVLKQRLPHNATVVGRAISRDAKRVAWLLQIDAVSPFDELLAMLLRISPKRQPTLGIWVSQVDRPGIEEVGHLAVTGRNPESPDLLDAYTLQWLPGSKKLSFVYKDQLYVADAP